MCFRILLHFAVFFLTHTLLAIAGATLCTYIMGSLTPPLSLCLLILSGIGAFVWSPYLLPSSSTLHEPTPPISPYVKWLIGSVVLATLLIHSVFLIFENGDFFSIRLHNNFGDLPLHMQIIRYIAAGGPFWQQSPILAGHPLIYPFGMDLYSALWESLGIPFAWHVKLGLFVSGASLVILLLAWGGPSFGGWFLVTAFFFNNGFPFNRLLFENAGFSCKLTPGLA